MTVEELIDMLRACDPKAPVVVHGYLGGFDDIDRLNRVSVALNVYTTETWRGSHESLEKLRRYEESANSSRTISSDLRRYISDATCGSIEVQPISAVCLEGQSVISQLSAKSGSGTAPAGPR